MSRLLERLGKRVAIISGRPSEQINAMFGGVNFAIAGSHGLEIRWPDGRTVEAQPPPHLENVMVEVARLKDRYPSLIVEQKRFGVALHYRLAPQAESDCRAVAMTLGEKTGLQIQSGKMVIELKAPWANKGTALSLMMTEADMAGTAPIFVGDDETDESGFEAARRLGGAGILVGPPRRTAAVYGLPDVDSTRQWLEAGAHAQ
jgi:trehalose 6-phosphate phosphatase